MNDNVDRIVEMLRCNTQWKDTFVVPSLTDLSQTRVAADLTEVEARLAQLPAELHEGLLLSTQQHAPGQSPRCTPSDI
jgi:hypothetical protein